MKLEDVKTTQDAEDILRMCGGDEVALDALVKLVATTGTKEIFTVFFSTPAFLSALGAAAERSRKQKGKE